MPSANRSEPSETPRNKYLNLSARIILFMAQRIEIRVTTLVSRPTTKEKMDGFARNSSDRELFRKKARTAPVAMKMKLVTSKRISLAKHAIRRMGKQNRI